jgi:hypothetical protein
MALQTRRFFTLLLACSGWMAQAAVAQERFIDEQVSQKPYAFEERIGDVLSGHESAAFPLRLCAAEDTSESAENPPLPGHTLLAQQSDAKPSELLQTAAQQPAALEPVDGGPDRAQLATTGVRGAGLFAGAEMTFLRPFAGDIRDLTLTGPSGNVILATSPPGNQFGAAPRFWMGYANGQGTGVRVRYWQFNHELASEVSDVPLDGPLPLPAGSHVVGDGHLNLYSIDLEIMHHMETRLFHADVSFGIRVAGEDRDRDFTFVIPGQADTVLGDTSSFTGFGPTMSAEIRRGIGESNFSMLITTRGSTLLGERHMNYFVNQDLNVAGVSLPIIAFQPNIDAEIFAGEVRMGVEWEKTLESGRKLYARALWETQFWAGSGVGFSGAGLMGGTFGLGMSH